MSSLGIDDELRTLAAQNVDNAFRRPDGHPDHALLGQRRAVRREDDVLQFVQRVVVARWLRVVDVDRRAGDDARLERRVQRLFIDDLSPGEVDQEGGGLEFDRYDDVNILARSVAEMSADVGEAQRSGGSIHQPPCSASESTACHSSATRGVGASRRDAANGPR